MQATISALPVDYGALHATVLRQDPFPHVVVRHFVPPASLAKIVRDLPEMTSGGSFPVGSVQLGPAAKALAAELEGATLRRAIAGKFGLDLSGGATMLTLRGQSREKDGQIHRDSGGKRVTALLYLNPPEAPAGGSLRLLRGPANLEDFAVEIPPVDGTLVVFPNGATTYHGHTPFQGRRYVMQLNYMASGGGARWEMWRHGVSAWLKRLTGG